MLIELSEDAISYAEDDGQLILHYSENGELILIEILNVTQFMSTDDPMKMTAFS
jgi:uncharacterized protein YuzE